MLSELARSWIELGRVPEARKASDKAVSSARRAEGSGPNAVLRALDAQSAALTYGQDFSVAIEGFRTVVERSDALGEMMLATRARINLGLALNRVGCFDQGKGVLERALVDTRILRMRAGEGLAIHHLGRSLGRMRDFDQAIVLQQEARRIGEETGHYRLMMLSRIYEAMLLQMRGQGGDLECALLLIEATRGEAKLHPFCDLEANMVHAFILQKVGDLSAALERCSAAMASLATLGTMEEGEEALRMVQVELLLALGKEDEASRALRSAYDRVMSRCMKMSLKEHRDAYLSKLFECRRIIDLASDRLSLTRPFALSIRPPSNSNDG